MHGGKSLYSIASPSFKHGWYSRYQPWVSLRRQEEERERRERWAAAVMKEIRAQRAEMEAQRLAEREKNWIDIDWECIGAVTSSLTLRLTEDNNTYEESDETAG